MMQADNNEKEEHLMCVIYEFEDSYLIYKIFIISLTLIMPSANSVSPLKIAVANWLIPAIHKNCSWVI